ncbi:MAG: hypothetical protein QUS33_09425 [Dehalococcoidia bacterium]|nr:hypothetical protein [Dehalococcoidia bacterium]
MKPFVFLLVTATLAYGLELKYDDGEYEGWAGSYQISGVWFDAEDFVSSCDSFDLDRIDIWFGDAPWATDSARIVIRAVDPEIGFPLPGVPIVNEWIIANPSGVTSLTFSPAITIPANFAVLEYGRSQAEPAPKIALDTTEAEGHTIYQQWGWGPIYWSFYTGGNFAIRCYGEPAEQALETSTWASIKRCI